MPDEQLKVLEEIRALGIEPFGRAFGRTHQIAELLKSYAGIKPDERVKIDVAIAGRIRSIRRHGGLGFADLEDTSGRIQLYVAADAVSEKEWELFARLCSGDIVGASGSVLKTKKGELSVAVKQLQLLTKAVRPLPGEWFGLRDIETRYRQRYLDLLMNPRVREIFITRGRIIDAMRQFLKSRGYVEVETPILQPIYGGALARPFTTFHNELKQTMYLRISNEMYLKRLIVGGFDKVFEFSYDFRNEGIDTKHNPEFLQLEAMTAYSDYRAGMALFEELVAHAAKAVLGTTKIVYQGQAIDLAPPWRRITMLEALSEYAGVDADRLSVDDLRKVAAQKGLEVAPSASKGELIAALFEELVEYKLAQPTIVYDFPAEVSPLAQSCPDSPAWTERFEVYINGKELGNNYTEINDPAELRRRFAEELRRGQAGDQEAHPMDEDFITAMEYGFPPTCGIGIGMDRLVMLLTDSPSIRDVILFPALRYVRGPLGDEVREAILKRKAPT